MLNKYTELGAVDLHTYSGGWSVRHCMLTLKTYIEGDGPEQIRHAVNKTGNVRTMQNLEAFA